MWPFSTLAPAGRQIGGRDNFATTHPLSSSFSSLSFVSSLVPLLPPFHHIFIVSLREAPLWKVPLLFKHCANSSQAGIWQHFFGAIFREPFKCFFVDFFPYRRGGGYPQFPNLFWSKRTGTFFYPKTLFVALFSLALALFSWNLP